MNCGCTCTLDYNFSSGPFMSFEIEIQDGLGPELDNRLRFKDFEFYGFKSFD